MPTVGPDFPGAEKNDKMLEKVREHVRRHE
jgi:hypothetical protein